MTHFIVLIIIPKFIFDLGPKVIKAYIEKQMEPFSEQLEVEPYIQYTKDQIQEQFEEFKKTNEHFFATYNTLEKFIKEYHAYFLDEYGNAISTYNPKSLYDWYVIGGRWDGRLTNNIQSSDRGFNWDDKHHTVENNSISVEELINKYTQNPDDVYNIIIDNEGKLHKQRDYGWFALYDETMTKEEWKKEYIQVLENSQNDFVVALDCHI